MIKLAFIEDDAVIHKSLQALFEQSLEIELVLDEYSLEDFLEKINANTPEIDILLLDIGLPGKSGIEGIQPIKQKMPTLDIVMFTTFEEEEKIFKALCLGACSYITKRTSLKQLIEAIFIIHRGGSYMSPSIARKVVQHFVAKPKKESILTERQKEIVKYIVDGLSYQKVADSLHISIETVRSHIKKIYKVLHIKSKAELIRKSLEGDI